MGTAEGCRPSPASGPQSPDWTVWSPQSVVSVPELKNKLNTLMASCVPKPSSPPPKGTARTAGFHQLIDRLPSERTPLCDTTDQVLWRFHISVEACKTQTVTIPFAESLQSEACNRHSDQERKRLPVTQRPLNPPPCYQAPNSPDFFHRSFVLPAFELYVK